FAHMHNTLKYEEYASAAERPHGFLLSPAAPLSLTYVTQLIRDELAIVPHPTFFHIGSDETSSPGIGQSAALVKEHGLARVYADHINQMNRLIAPSGARLMLWDDGIENDPAIMKLIPKRAVIINWHYGAQKTFLPDIQLLASGGFDQMVAPGANNWNEIYPDITTALRNEKQFINEGKAAHVFGLFQTVWHDDGESLYESTWYPVIYSAAAAWELRSVEPARFADDFAPAFFGSRDDRYASDVAKLADILTRVEVGRYDSSDYLFWADPFDPRIAQRMQRVDLRTVRLEAEAVMTHLISAKPSLHSQAAAAMFLAARRYDALARHFQIAQEVRDYYADAKSQIGAHRSRTVLDLFWCKYWFWEMRDSYEDIAPLYARAWSYESRPDHLAGNLERYHLAAGRAITRADKIQTMTNEEYLAQKTFPTLEETLGLHDLQPSAK
ncbi:MAG: family 20 glycosylhydrolase, partial [Candidatus Eremiobacteraeota bacterium]|nr:family 20 glycosylhydrolase [Candidatus Eremiobacteraeota bacterium]